MKWLMAIPVWSTPRDSLNRFNLVFSRCPYEESPFVGFYYHVFIVSTSTWYTLYVCFRVFACYENESYGLFVCQMLSFLQPSQIRPCLLLQLCNYTLFRILSLHLQLLQCVKQTQSRDLPNFQCLPWLQ